MDRPIVFIRSKHKYFGPSKIPIVVDVQPPKPTSKAHIIRKENKITPAPPTPPEKKFNIDEAKTSEQVLDQTLGEKPEILPGDDVEILRIPFELKNSKPVRNQIKEFIGETMPELILKPRRGRPSTKHNTERSLIKNNNMFQITLHNSDEALQNEENASKKTISKMEKQMYGRDIQQQFAIEQAVSSIAGLDSPDDEDSPPRHEFNHPVINLQNVHQFMKKETPPKKLLPDLNILSEKEFYKTPSNPAPMKISKIEVLSTNKKSECDKLVNAKNPKYENGHDYKIKISEDLQKITESDLHSDETKNKEYATINKKHEQNEDQLEVKQAENSSVDYESANLILNQYDYNLDTSLFRNTGNLSDEYLLQSAFPDLQIEYNSDSNTISIPDPQESNFAKTQNTEAKSGENETLNTNGTTVTNVSQNTAEDRSSDHEDTHSNHSLVYYDFCNEMALPCNFSPIHDDFLFSSDTDFFDSGIFANPRADDDLEALIIDSYSRLTDTGAPVNWINDNNDNAFLDTDLSHDNECPTPTDQSKTSDNVSVGSCSSGQMAHEKVAGYECVTPTVNNIMDTPSPPDVDELFTFDIDADDSNSPLNMDFSPEFLDEDVDFDVLEFLESTAIATSDMERTPGSSPTISGSNSSPENRTSSSSSFDDTPKKQKYLDLQEI